MKCVIQGVSVIAPGLEGWEQAAAVLRGEQTWTHEPLGKLTPALLPPNERRRTTQLIKLALQTAEAAQQQSGIDAAALACVFASSDGDTFIVDRLCDALSLPDRPVSPTQFHNSVHNAPAGYWAIASGARRFSTSISAGAASFSAGLLEAMTYVASEGEPVLLVVYDVALPETLDAFGINHEHFAVALVLVPEGEPGMAGLSLADSAAATELPEGLDTLRRANPAGESLPLLKALAAGQNTSVALAYLGSELNIAVMPC